MLGLNNARINALEAENRILRDELLAAVERNDGLRRIIANLRRENDKLAQLVNAMATATQQPPPDKLGDGGTVTAQGAMQRLCWN